MKDPLTFLSSTAGKITAILTLLAMLGGGALSFFNWQASLVREAELESQLQDIATKTEVAIEMNDLAIELISVAIMRYEDELMGLGFLVESGEATPMERVKHQNTINRLNTLKEKLGRLEDTAQELQRGSAEAANTETGSQVTK